METETTNKLTISAEDFKLIKSFLPSFTRAAGIQTNDYVIDWNSIMPVVEKIAKMDVSFINSGLMAVARHKAVTEMLKTCDIGIVYKAVLEFIKWYNNQKENGNRNS